ncbi:MAG: cytochrome P450 [Synechococcales cyanobacterium RM1_1_8]|nr:cytochrome P450 [Synechococcales cyanobacterium RM1_1_8]
MSSSLPPGPRLPNLLQTARLIATPLGFLDECAERYGDCFTLRVLGLNSPPVVFFSDPEAVQAIFTTLADQFDYGKVTQVFRPLVGHESLIMQQGDRHRRQRKMLMPALHGEQLNGYGSVIQAITQDITAPWAVGQTLSIRERMADISLEVILRVVFGIDPGPRCDALRQRLAKLLEAITAPLYSVQFFLPPLQQNLGPSSPWGGFLQQRAEIDGLIFEEIRNRRAQSSAHQPSATADPTSNPSTEPKDVLGLLMTMTDGEGQPLSDQELRDQLMTLLLLGHETTAGGLTWAFYWLSTHPQALAQLQQELCDAPADLDPMALAQLPYLSAVCQESLRLNPIALISQPRKLKQPLDLAGYHFEPGAVLIPCIYTSHRRAATYGDPLQFRPERFLEQKFSAAEYFPFGGGSRNCIGMALSLYEMKLILAQIVSRYSLSLAAKGTVRPQRRGITFVPGDNFRLRIEQDRACGLNKIALAD